MSAPSQRSLPWSWYADPDVERRERELIFRRAWQYAGRRAELTAPGSFAAMHVAGLPVVLTRDRDDVLRAFANVCRHRGSVVASGAGERGTLQCPYHAWTYGLDGSLRAAPRTEPGFADGGPGLVPLAVGTWGPFVFVNPDPDAAPLGQALGDLPAIVRERGLDVEALRFHHRVEYEIRANWKIALENYLECYHCRLNHPGLVAVIDDRRLTMEAAGLRASQFNPAHPDFDVAGGLAQGQFHLLFPSLKVNVEPGPRTSRSARSGRSRRTAAAASWTTSSRPTPTRTGSRSSWRSTTRSAPRTPALVEAAQAGAGSGLVEDGFLLGHDEQLIAHFQAYVRERLTRGDRGR